MKVCVTVRARRDLDGIFDYLNEKSPLAAEAVFQDIEAAISVVGEYPESSRLTSTSGVRVKIVRRSRYLIFYRIRFDVVELLRIRHSARLTLFTQK